MEILFKVSAAVLICLVLLLILDQQQKHIAILICIAICCMIIAVSVDFFQDILRMIRQLQRTAGLDGSILSILMKSVAVALICEITSMICTESGYGSMGKVLQFLSMAMIIYFALPLLDTFLELVSDLLGGL